MSVVESNAVVAAWATVVVEAPPRLDKVDQSIFTTISPESFRRGQAPPLKVAVETYCPDPFRVMDNM